MSTIDPTAQLKEVQKRAAELLSTKGKLEDALARATAQLPAARKAVEDILEKQRKAEAESFLTESAPSTKPGRRALTEARETLDALEAATEGLTMQLDANMSEMLKLKDAAEAAHATGLRSRWICSGRDTGNPQRGMQKSSGKERLSQLPWNPALRT